LLHLVVVGEFDPFALLRLMSMRHDCLPFSILGAHFIASMQRTGNYNALTHMHRPLPNCPDCFGVPGFNGLVFAP
tara:strand:+ start:100 stop:324 length:225 start_codon:yes stop_codon:yes gene_type:complete